jgi:hypothetical protein
MSMQSDRVTNQPLGISPALEADVSLAAVSRKPWTAPTVITGTTVLDTESAGGLQADLNNPS